MRQNVVEASQLQLEGSPGVESGRNSEGPPGGTRHSAVRRWSSRLAGGLNLAFDLTALALAAIAAAALSGEPRTAALAGFTVGVVTLWAAGSFVARYYDPWASNRLVVEDAALLSLLVLGASAGLGMLRLITGGAPGLPRIEHFSLLLWPAVLLPRLLLFRRLGPREDPLDEVLIVGVGALGRCTAEELEGRRRPRRRVMGHLRLAGESAVGEVRGLPVLGHSDELERCLRTYPVSEVYIAGDTTRHAAGMQAAVQTCERFGVPFALPAFSLRLDRARPTCASAVSDGYLHYVTHDVKPHQLALKRLFDILASTSALVVLSPLLLLVAALVKLTSRGPVFFKQQRVGLHGQPFKMLKFRTMVVDAEQRQAQLLERNEQTGPVFKIKDDPRITPIGRILRKHSIDELPQLINVLRGDMSVVGPRPPVPKEVAQYEPWQRRRLSVRPGLTCIWQVSGRNQISFEEWMYLDMRYIDHWSLDEDLRLILKTFPVVLTGRGAS